MKHPAAGWRWIVDPPADAAWNMAVDEALLSSYAGFEPPPAPTLRLYSFSPPALSLGRAQRAATAHDPRYLREQRIDLVRRPTGGAAVLHEHERTYAVAGRLRDGPFPGGVLDTYRRVAEALCAGLAELGLAARSAERRAGVRVARPAGACFAATSAHEITVGGLKLVGSAQLRRRGAFLQHGSILTRADPLRLARAIGPATAGAASFTDLERALGRPLDPAELDRVLARGFAECFGTQLRPGRLSESEHLLATRLRAAKYLSAAWTFEGREPEERRPRLDAGPKLFE